ncbi:MAG: hypothetical protein ACKO3T_03370 [Planctomycetaceae bacterium]
MLGRSGGVFRGACRSATTATTPQLYQQMTTEPEDTQSGDTHGPARHVQPEPTSVEQTGNTSQEAGSLKTLGRRVKRIKGGS